MPLLPLRLFRGNVADDLVETFSGFADLAIPAPFEPVQAIYTGAAVNIADGDTDPLPFTQLLSGIELLDRSVPTLPTLLADGTYALTATVNGEPPTPGGYAIVSINFQPIGDLAHAASPLIVEGCTVTAVWKAAAGDHVKVTVTNKDGVAAHNYFMPRGVLVKLAD